ncbi:MAG: hypothetical protein HC929_16325 [Leptolyngbyaceae cyanobacterium SM2_5_2]|nr:hypothetical protein [Leptolyngbyaceae cyanobacterium SM2_5_2]
MTSGDIFKGLGLWPQIGPHICHFQQVRLSDADYPGVVRFLPKDLGTEAVYYGAEHTVLMAALQRAVEEAGDIFYVTEARLEVEERRAGTVVTGRLATPAGERPLQAALVVAADGKQSPLRQQANIQAFGWQYWQACITTVLEPEADHQNTRLRAVLAQRPLCYSALAGAALPGCVDGPPG